VQYKTNRLYEEAVSRYTVSAQIRCRVFVVGIGASK
jgi:hypothetical protein